MDSTVTGPLRICKPSEMEGRTQYRGGSEVTTVSAYDAIEGNAVGHDKKPFKQHLEVMKIKQDRKS